MTVSFRDRNIKSHLSMSDRLRKDARHTITFIPPNVCWINMIATFWALEFHTVLYDDEKCATLAFVPQISFEEP